MARARVERAMSASSVPMNRPPRSADATGATEPYTLLLGLE
jgi:hypothetical protein